MYKMYVCMYWSFPLATFVESYMNINYVLVNKYSQKTNNIDMEYYFIFQRKDLIITQVKYHKQSPFQCKWQEYFTVRKNVLGLTVIRKKENLAFHTFLHNLKFLVRQRVKEIKWLWATPSLRAASLQVRRESLSFRWL